MLQNNFPLTQIRHRYLKTNLLWFKLDLDVSRQINFDSEIRIRCYKLILVWLRLDLENSKMIYFDLD